MNSTAINAIYVQSLDSAAYAYSALATDPMIKAISSVVVKAKKFAQDLMVKEVLLSFLCAILCLGHLFYSFGRVLGAFYFSRCHNSVKAFVQSSASRFSVFCDQAKEKLSEAFVGVTAYCSIRFE